MINLGTDKIKDIYMGIDEISKVYLGTDLIWEKVKFEGLYINGFGEVAINDGREYELPLNIPMKFIPNTAQLNVIYIISKGKEYRLFRGSTTFEIRSKGPFKMLGENFWDIKVVKSDETPTVII